MGMARRIQQVSKDVLQILASNGLLFGVSPIDPAVFLGTASLLFCSALSSMLFPALRAIRIDPIVALRYE
jgi:ABC-type antimicrobial peptide transport system permease subunit